MATSQTVTERWYLTAIPALIAWSTFLFSAGVYFGRDGALDAVAVVRADLRVLAEVVSSHAAVEVHDGAALKVVMERELAVIRGELNRVEATVQRNHP